MKDYRHRKGRRAHGYTEAIMQALLENPRLSALGVYEALEAKGLKGMSYHTVRRVRTDFRAALRFLSKAEILSESYKHFEELLRWR